MSAVMCRAVYQYDGLFQHLIKSYFNNKFILEQFMNNAATNTIDLYKPILVEKGAAVQNPMVASQNGGEGEEKKGLSLGAASKITSIVHAKKLAHKKKQSIRLGKLMKRLEDTTTFVKNSGQYLATLINSTNDIAADFDYEKIGHCFLDLAYLGLIELKFN